MPLSVLDPLGVFLAISGTKGTKLLFRYPFEITEKRKIRGNNPYSLMITEDVMNRPIPSEVDDSKKAHRSSSLILVDDPPALSHTPGTQRLRSFADDTLEVIFTSNIKNSLYNHKFEFKMDDVVFVGHPQIVQSGPAKAAANERHLSGEAPQRQYFPSSIQMFHVVFALRGESCSQFVIDSYHRLSQKLSIAINHEEARQNYLSQNVKQITTYLDMHHGIGTDNSSISPYETILEKNALAGVLKKTFDDIIRNGQSSVRVNDWIQVSFCLLPKIHRNVDLNEKILAEQTMKMRPYHGLLLLESEQELFVDLPIDASPALVRFIRIISPLSNFQLLAMEAGVTLSQVYAMAGHLIYWAKAKLIFPVCEANVYALAPEAPIKVLSDTGEEFLQRFSVGLIEMLADFSLPQPMRDLINPFAENLDLAKLTQIVIWCLRKNLLIQLHTYVYLIPEDVDDLGYLQKEGLNWLTLPHEIRLKIGSIPAAISEQNSDMVTFTKLIPYFRGNAHLEEMMFNVNIKRSQLTIVLDKFRDVLVAVTHEDPNLPVFSKV